MKPRVTYRIVPGDAGFLAVLDESGKVISVGEDLRNTVEATKFAEDWANERGLSVSVVPPKGVGLGADDRPMTYSSSTLQEIESFRDRIGRLVRRLALEAARADGRRLVTNDYASRIIDEIEDQVSKSFPSQDIYDEE